jgi:DNA-binding transcriptional LysR family regulator
MPQTIGIHYLPSILSRFQKQFPEVGFHFHHCAFHNLEHELQTGTTDLGFLLAESITSPNLVAEPLRFEPIVLVANPDNPLANGSEVSIHDLEGHPLFLAIADCGYRMVFERVLAEQKVEPRTLLEFSSIESMRESIKAGQGVAIIPEISVREEIQRGSLAVLPWADGPMESAVLMIWHKDKWLSPTLRAFMDEARAVMGG